MDWKKILFKVDYFTSAKAYHKGVLLSILMLVAIVIMMFDIYGSIVNKYILMAILESIAILLVILLYFIFPKYISLERTINIVLGFLTLFILISLTVPGHNHEFVLFALAIVPANLFSLLGLQKGVIWSQVVVLLLILTTVNAYMSWITPLFTVNLLLQVSVAYVALSIFHYMVEKEKNRYDNELELTLKSQQVLLKEVHHRAKNNLQTIMGLLESQAMRAEDNKCKKLLTAQRSRLQSMSLLHEHLSVESSYEKVNMRQYLSQILYNIQNNTKHQIDVDIDSFRLAMNEAINIGLFLNEAVSNAIEHAYSPNEIGKIEVSLKYEERKCTVKIQDFGKGFTFNSRPNSLGLVLMDDIINFFPDSSMEIDFDGGVGITAEFSC